MGGKQALILALVLVVAGCHAGTGTPAATGPATETQTTAGNATVTVTNTVSRSGTTPSENPWGESTLTVAVHNEASPWRNVTKLVETGLRFWERNDDRYAGYQVDYRLIPDARNPDVVVRYVTDIGACSGTTESEAVGYAPRVPSGSEPPRPATICIRAGYTDPTTLTILEHEFGHLLGLRHGDAPRPLMQTSRRRTVLPQPSDSFRAFAWNDSTLSVYVDYSTIYARRDYRARRQMNHLLAYYERAAPSHVGHDVSFVQAPTRASADVLVTFPRHSRCPDPRWGSCGRIRTARDGDPQVHLTLTNAHEEAIGWHVGYWLGFTFEPTHRSEIPPPFRNTSLLERRDPWWR